MEIQRNDASGADSWRDTTYKDICDIFSSENEQHIYKRIQRLIGGSAHFGKMAYLGLFRRISNIFQGKYSKKPVLPQDLVLEIVSRLPAEDVLNCLVVCKAVTLTPPFLDLHQKRSPPVILLQNCDGTNDMMLYSLDLTHERPCIRTFNPSKLLDRGSALAGTCDGLLLLTRPEGFHSFHLSICNPLTGRVVMRLAVGAENFCALWFHPSKKEYLFLTSTWDRCGHCYKIFNLRGESTVVGWYDAIPAFEVSINIGCFLYCLLTIHAPTGNCLMIFNIETEKVDFKPHPHSGHCFRGHLGLSESGNGDMRLLELEGSLAFAHVCAETNCLYLWILVDHTTWHWVERCKIDLNWHGHILCPINAMVYPLGVQKGEMLMLYHSDTLIAFNLKTRRIRKVDLNTVSVDSRTSVVSTTYRSSLVGLYRLAHMTC